jgi:hypothetical protein
LSTARFKAETQQAQKNNDRPEVRHNVSKGFRLVQAYDIETASGKQGLDAGSGGSSHTLRLGAVISFA